jgi:hypothetical protein
MRDTLSIVVAISESASSLSFSLTEMELAVNVPDSTRGSQSTHSVLA